MNEVVLGGVGPRNAAPRRSPTPCAPATWPTPSAPNERSSLVERAAAGPAYAAVAIVEAAVSVLVVASMWRGELVRRRPRARRARCAAFLVYVSVLRRRRYAATAACSAFEAAPTRWSLLPGARRRSSGCCWRPTDSPTASAFASPAGATESTAAVVLALTLGFLIWMFPAGIYRDDGRDGEPMTFGQAVTILLAVCVFVLAATMANLLARITVLERRLRDVGLPDPGRLVRWTDLPRRAQDLLDPIEGGLLLFVSRDCVACDEAVGQLAEWPQEARRRSRVVFWGQPRPDFVAPAGVRILADASDLYTELDVTRTPWFIEVADGAIQRRGIGLPSRREPAEPARGAS